MADTLQILMLEDSVVDAELAERALKRGQLGFNLRRVDNETDFLRELEELPPDLILADYNLPSFDGLTAIRLAKERTPEIPIIVVSGSLGDELAVEVLKQGATDYVLKDRLHRLPAAVLRARQEALDAQQRRRFERELRDERDFVTGIIETAGSLVAVFDSEARFVRINQTFTQVIGFTAAEVVGKFVWEVGHAADNSEEVRNAFEELLHRGMSRHERSMVARDGTSRTILWHGNVLRREQSTPEFVVTVGTDLTEMRGLEERLEQSRRLESLGRVAATIAHEFNNVLMSIEPYAELLRRRPSDLTNVKKSSDQISRAVKRGQRITQEVTRFTRPAEPNLRPLAVNKWLAGFTEEMSEMIGNGVEVYFIPSEHDPWVLGDSAQLHQVFSNLVVNARDAMKGVGRITLLVEIDRTLEKHNVHIGVRDNGSGIAPDVLARIFEPLFTTKRSGTGLGLAVALQVIVAHKGRIFAESVVSGGTTFHVLLPELSAGIAADQ